MWEYLCGNSVYSSMAWQTGLTWPTGTHYSGADEELCSNLRVYVLLSLLHHAGVSLEQSPKTPSSAATRREPVEVVFYFTGKFKLPPKRKNRNVTSY
jgi:hypothetical protein